ncbi:MULTISPECIES: PP0621 family protein [Piscinibacter]|uniref:PP0621 family protein n=1 Tax=Piscinibacter TaxID=1114981 RepID=UPI001F0C9C1A|nr:MULTISPECIES: PP0621 family protein [Piscinibacter]
MLKFVLLIVVVLVLLWLLRGKRRAAEPPPGPAREAGGSRPVVACAQCGVHLPRDEALPGRGGVFCGEAHRAEYERSHPDA